MKQQEEITPEEKVPVFSTWNKWYIFCILLLVAQIVFFYLLTFVFNASN